MKKYWAKITRTRKRKIIFFSFLALLIGAGFYFIFSSYHQVLPQSAIYFLNDAKLPQKGQTVLVFSPHPDDETIGAGGYIYDSVKAGANVYIVLVTDGNKHGLKDRRYEEFKKATGILGVPEKNLIFLNHPDGRLKSFDQGKLTTEFQSQIEQKSPQIIIYPHPLDMHPDHALTGQIIEKLLKNDYPSIIGYQYLVHEHFFPRPKKLKQDLYLLPPIRMIQFDKEWVRLMLDSETENIKNQAISAYQSQIHVPFLRSLFLSNIRKNELFNITNN